MFMFSHMFITILPSPWVLSFSMTEQPALSSFYVCSEMQSFISFAVYLPDTIFIKFFQSFMLSDFFQAKVTWMFTMVYPESFSHKQCQIICVAQLCSNAFQFLLLYLVVEGWRLNCVFLGISNPKFLKCALTLLDAHFPFCLAKCGCFQFYFFFAFRVWHSKRMRWWKRNLPARQGFKHVSAFLVPFLKYVLTM